MSSVLKVLNRTTREEVSISHTRQFLVDPVNGDVYMTTDPLSLVKSENYCIDLPSSSFRFSTDPLMVRLKELLSHCILSAPNDLLNGGQFFRILSLGGLATDERVGPIFQVLQELKSSYFQWNTSSGVHEGSAFTKIFFEGKEEVIKWLKE